MVVIKDSMKKNKVFIFCMMFFMMPLEIMSNHVDASIKKGRFNKKKIITNVVLGMTAVTMGSIGLHVWFRKPKRTKKDEQELGALTGLSDAEKKGLASLRKPATLLTQKVYDPKEYKLVDISKEINPSATQQLNDALGSNNSAGMRTAIQNGALNHPDAAKLFWRVNNANALYSFVENYPQDKREELLAMKNDDGNTLLLHTVKINESPGLVKALMDVGAAVNVCELGTKKTPLMYAADYDNTELFVLLVEHGADLHAVDLGNNSALRYIGEKSPLLRQIRDYEQQYPTAIEKISAWLDENL